MRATPTHTGRRCPAYECRCNTCEATRKSNDEQLSADQRQREQNRREARQEARQYRQARAVGLDLVGETLAFVDEYCAEALRAEAILAPATEEKVALTLSAVHLARRLWEADVADRQRLDLMGQVLARDAIADALDREFPGNWVSPLIRYTQGGTNGR